MRVEVLNGDIDRALKRLKHKLIRQGIWAEEKQHRHYSKPSEVRQRRKEEAKKRRQRDLKRQLIRIGEIPDPKPKRAIRRFNG